MKKNEREAIGEATSVLYANNKYFERVSKKLFGHTFPSDMIAGNVRAYERLMELTK